jgi:hypothetical protein
VQIMNGYKQNKRDLQPIKYLLSLLFLFPLTLAQPIFASATHTMNVSAPPTPTVPANPGFAHAKVSVVRLLASYTDSNDPTRTTATCTGLAVLVKSLPVSSGSAGTTLPNDRVLTDGSLVDPAQATCTGLPVPMSTLSQIQIHFNTTSKHKEVIVDGTSTQSVSTAITCSNATNCSNGPPLIASHGDQASPVGVETSPLEHGASVALLLLALGGGLLTAHVIRFRRVRTSRLLQADQAEWERRAAILAREMRTIDTARRDWVEHRLASEQPSAPSSTALTLRIEFDAADIRADINARQLMEQKGR